MIDIHNHLLPGIDDGSNDITKSLEQLRILAEEGVEKVYLTPHYMQNLYPNSRSAIKPVLIELRNAVKKAGINIELETGAEYFLDHLAAETVARENLTLGSSRYVLVETMMQQIPVDFLQNIYLLQKAGYKVILAHPERYADVIRDPEYVEELLHHDIYLQVNAGSFLGVYGKSVERTAFQLLQNGYLHFIASDNHGDQPQCFQKIIYQMLTDNFSEAIARLLLQENPAALNSDTKIAHFNHWRLPQPRASVWQNIMRFFTGHE
ncbi:MAG: capsular biosynthesis protein [Candidatus Cloacimonetes bacterium]|nr:capsular biosynthesis protein [Candidatus Cloacimonadota bacterium]